MNILIVVDHDHQNIFDGNRQLVRAALDLSSNVVLLVIGVHTFPLAEQAARIPGVKKVLWVDDFAYQDQFAENMGLIISSLANAYTHIFLAASSFGKDLLPRVAGLLNMGQVSQVIEIIDEKTFIHPIYAGSALETVRVLDDKVLLTIQTSAFSRINGEQEPCPLEQIERRFSVPAEISLIDHQEDVNSNRPDLDQAKIIVAGGRGIQSKNQFKIIEDFADAIGAGIAASRGAVDLGCISSHHLIGQTGKIVSPLIYIAIGISGAIQHLTGIRDAKLIIAINIDEQAPIAELADYLLVGDLFEIIPRWLEKIQLNQENLKLALHDGVEA